MKVRCYLQVEPLMRRGSVVGARAHRMTQSYPRDPIGVVVQVELELPKSVFGPILLAAEVRETEQVAEMTEVAVVGIGKAREES